MSNFFERKKQELGIKLNKVQQQAVLETEGPLLLLACPGSGKTTTMIMRIGYLIEEKNVSPRRIKAITFSRASAADMKARFARFFPDIPAVDFSTIHSLAFTITRTYLDKLGKRYELIEGQGTHQFNKQSLLKRLYKDVLKDDCTDDELATLSTFISSLKNKLIPIEQWGTVTQPFPKAGEIAQKYEQHKTRQADFLYVDFDDMLVLAEKALRTDDELADRFRERYDYLLTDESQDTSLVQHMIVEHLVAYHGNLCVVADDDQSIYTWRGADPNYLLEFKKVYPDAKILKMEQNYRSSKDIVNASATFIKRNRDRYPKDMFTKNEKSRPIHLKQVSDPKQQLDYVIYELLNEQNLNEVAILFRNNASSTLYVSELHRRGIPFYMKDADDRFFSHWIIEDILNFMRLSFNVERKDIFTKIIMKMNLFVSRNMVTQFEKAQTSGNVFDAFIRTVTLKSRQVKKLQAYKKGYVIMPEMRPMRVIQLIRNDLGYEAALKSRAEKFGYRFDHMSDILDTLENIAMPLRTMVEFAERLKELEEAVQNAKFNPPENAVTLSTFHSAKGLEFERVFMIDLQKGIIPSEEDENDKATLEEARRLFYVGMTRAKQRLELLSYREEDGKKKEDSRFLNEVRGILTNAAPKVHAKKQVKSPPVKSGAIPINPKGIQNRKDLVNGVEVVHRVFGKGTILEVEGQRLVIQFNKEQKEFDIETILQYRLLELV
ncbi:ATP-dependent helicase [Sporosarcina pasteurii]|uniref:DNA 3'-5' helicase n=1 Tax=Sporosarcina pasteurii TaxID=1474 RepID=A0A380CA28_SPOPA|nr:ATP-dependent helicase [Sporosarcina pasteurii]MDS9472968.1 ATP-dependent helicase [Sporosarcina pasteurii]QBQ04484.1 ATP-dependent helicase [Sporosarcina pasteurii]SUJ14540.1 ATP-dependent DNA helicase pcrA [Sporosarcina pasteurii]